MGTRGTLKVYLNGELKVRQYNQWDSYPTGQFAGICEFMSSAYNVDTLAEKLSYSRFFTLEEVERIEQALNVVRNPDGKVVMTCDKEDDMRLAFLYENLVNRDYGYQFLYAVAGMGKTYIWEDTDAGEKMQARYLIPDWELVFRNSVFGPFGDQEGNYIIEITKKEDEKPSFVVKGEWHGTYREFPPNTPPTQAEIEAWEKEGYGE